jgi:hypothetical protein
MVAIESDRPQPAQTIIMSAVADRRCTTADAVTLMALVEEKRKLI